MPGKHAIFSPSGFKALMLCPAKPAMERGLPDASSDYADEGTAAHFLAAHCLDRGTLPAAYVNGQIMLWRHDESDSEGTCWIEDATSEMDVTNTFTVTDEMVDAVQVYVDLVRDLAGDDGELLVEQALPIAHITGEQDAEGTGDAVILRGDEIIVVDLKYGKGVEVSAIDNPQLMLYGLGALEKFALMGDFAGVRMVISQPRVSTAPSEHAMSVVELMQWSKDAARAAFIATNIYSSEHREDYWPYAKPHPEACRFCKAKATCPALSASVQTALSAEFTDLTTKDATAQEQIVKQLVADVPADNLGAKMDSVELVEMWCKAIRARCESVLLAGGAVAGYKLVAGKRGARAWSDEAEAEKALKSFRLKKEQMYDMKVISPTSAEKLLKPQPKRWTKLQALIKQGEGKPSVAPIADARPALAVKPIESEFEVIEPQGAEDLV
jgi:hypothetical protein